MSSSFNSKFQRRDSFFPSIHHMAKDRLLDPHRFRPLNEIKVEPHLLESLANYSYNPDLCREGQVVAVVKNLKQQAMTLGQTLSVQKETVLGGEQIRKYAEGILVSFDLNCDELTSSNVNEITKDLEPCGLDLLDSRLVYAAGDKLKICDISKKTTYEYEHPWFASLHSVQISPDKKNFLVASTGFDTVFEIEIETGNVSWEWNAWENFFSESKLGHHVTNNQWLYDSLLYSEKFFDKEVIHVDDPDTYRNSQGRNYGIPAKYRAEHLNTARYFGEDKILITFFHSGSVLVVDKVTQALDRRLTGFANPHNFSAHNDGFYLADTRNGRYLEFDSSLNLKGGVSLEGLNCNVRDKQAPEWLQNANYLPDGTLCMLDVHRRNIWLVDRKDKTYRGIKIPNKWALQELHFCPEDIDLFSDLEVTNFESVPVWCQEPTPDILEEVSLTPLPKTPDWKPEKRDFLWKAEVASLMERANWEMIRTCSTSKFVSWIGQELGIDIAILNQSKREEVVNKFRELTGYNYNDFDSYASNLLKKNNFFEDLSRTSVNYFSKRLLGSRSILDQLLSESSITHPGINSIYSPSDPFRTILLDFENNVISKLVKEIGLKDPWSARGLVLNQDIMFEKHMWNKPVIFFMAIQTLAQLYGETSRRHVEGYRLAGPEVLESTFRFSYLLGGKNGVLDSCFSLRNLHSSFMQKDERTPEVRALEVVYRKALNGDLFKDFNVSFKEDEYEKNWNHYWSFLEGNEWQSLYARLRNSVLGRCNSAISEFIKNGEAAPTLIIGRNNTSDALYLHGKNPSINRVPIVVIDYENTQEDRTLKRYSIESIGVRPEFITSLDMKYKPRVILLKQSFSHTALKETLKTINHIADKRAKVFLLLHAETGKAKRIRREQLNLLNSCIAVTDAGIKFLKQEISKPEFKQLVRENLRYLPSGSQKQDLHNLKESVLSCSDSLRVNTIHTLQKELYDSLKPKRHAYFERYKTLNCVPDNVFSDPKKATGFFSKLGFELSEVYPLINGDFHSKNLIELTIKSN